MTPFRFRSLYSSASLQTCWKSTFLLVLANILTLATSCSNNDQPINQPIQKGIISSYNEYDGAMLNFSKADMDKAGFSLGDLISIAVDDKIFDIPYYDGYYTRSGELLLVAYPSYPSICFTADPTADDYNKRLIVALKELPSRPAPYVIHCMEGKDRTGYVCAQLEGLCGATYEEMVADYLITYNNYYGVTPRKTLMYAKH